MSGEPFRATHPILSLSLSFSWSRRVQAWQVNKNMLVKGKIGNSAFSFLVAAKSYTAPRLVCSSRRLSQVPHQGLCRVVCRVSCAACDCVPRRWWNPSATVALTVSTPFDGASRGTRIGLAFSIENWGGIGYHRPADTYKRYVPMQYSPPPYQTSNNSEK
mgnify:CR=1 FL=1